MKRFISFSLLCFLLISGIIFAADMKLKVTCDPWAPWIEGKAGEKPTSGYAVKIIDEILKEANIDYDIKIYPFKRCLAQIKSGQRDIILMVSKNKEREKYMEFSEVFAQDPYLLYYSNKVFKRFYWDDYSELTDYRIGGVNGFNYGDEFKAAEKKYVLKVKNVKNAEQNLIKMEKGRLDLVIINKTKGNYLINKFPKYASYLKHADKPIIVSNYYIGFSKKSKLLDLLPKINKAITKLQKSGRIDQIISEN